MSGTEEHIKSVTKVFNLTEISDEITVDVVHGVLDSKENYFVVIILIVKLTVVVLGIWRTVKYMRFRKTEAVKEISVIVNVNETFTRSVNMQEHVNTIQFLFFSY